jgi:hypothetical protein
MAWQAKRLAEWQHGQHGWMGIPLNSMALLAINYWDLDSIFMGIN